MAYPNVFNVTRRKVDGWIPINKFGANLTLGTTLEPISPEGIYRMPQVSGAQRLRIRAGGTTNNAAGTGAREVTIEGLDTQGAFITETLIPNGAAAGVLSEQTFLRVFRAYMTATGSYVDLPDLVFQEGVLIIEDSAGNEWARIEQDPDSQTGLGQSTIGCYSVRKDYGLEIVDIDFSAALGTDIDIFGFKRGGILEETAPYSPWRVFFYRPGVNNARPDFPIPLGVIGELTDIVFLARAANPNRRVILSWDGVLLRGATEETSRTGAP